MAGPYLVVAPLSTLRNWRNEFARFAPDLDAVLYHGDPAVRKRLRSLYLGHGAARLCALFFVVVLLLLLLVVVVVCNLDRCRVEGRVMTRRGERGGKKGGGCENGGRDSFLLREP